MSYIVTNKWMKAGYGEPLRRFFSEKSWIKSVVDFGHAKQIFEEADVFPCIIVAEKPSAAEKPKSARLCTIPREQLRIDDLSSQIEREGSDLDLSHIGIDGWQLEPDTVTAVFTKLSAMGVPMSQFIGAQPIYGIKTGCNEAFFVGSARRKEMIAEDPGCEGLFVRYYRGQDIKRWKSAWDGEWLVALRSSNEIEWPWSHAEEAETIFAKTYPSLHRHMASHRKALQTRKNNVRFWWELSSFSAWKAFESTKIIYQEIQFHPSYALESESVCSNNKTFILPTGDRYVLALLNSPMMWWFTWRYLPHMKDEALSPSAFLMEKIPVVEPSPDVRQGIETAVDRLIEITATRQQTQSTLLDWLRVEYGIEKPGNKLQVLTTLDSDTFVAEVKRIRGAKQPLTAAGLQALRQEYSNTIEPARTLAAEALKLERQINDLVNQAYGLTPEEIDLMWKTAPPRMPIPGPL
jgi:hypothetical protein